MIGELAVVDTPISVSPCYEILEMIEEPINCKNSLPSCTRTKHLHSVLRIDQLRQEFLNILPKDF